MPIVSKLKYEGRREWRLLSELPGALAQMIEEARAGGAPDEKMSSAFIYAQPPIGDRAGVLTMAVEWPVVR